METEVIKKKAAQYLLVHVQDGVDTAIVYPNKLLLVRMIKTLTKDKIKYIWKGRALPVSVKESLKV
jgi:hypothetical protein